MTKVTLQCSGDRMVLLNKSIGSTTYEFGKKVYFSSTSHIYNNPGGFQKKASETIQRRTSLGPRVALVYFVHLFLVMQHKAGSKAYCIPDSVLGSRETRADKT